MNPTHLCKPIFPDVMWPSDEAGVCSFARARTLFESVTEPVTRTVSFRRMLLAVTALCLRDMEGRRSVFGAPATNSFFLPVLRVTDDISVCTTYSRTAHWSSP